MADPSIPLIELPELDLTFLKYIPVLGDMVDPADPPSIKPFGTLVAIGVYVGSWLTMKRCRERGLAEKPFSDFIFWVVATGFVLSHMLDAIAYHPETVAKDPLYLLRIWDGLSSYGGLIGAAVGAFAWSFSRRNRIDEYVDITVSCFPIAWVFGRMGCSSVHDHPGMASNAWYAIKCEGETAAFCQGLPAGFTGRLDLGLLELIITLPLAFLCIYLWRKKPLRVNGFYCALTLIYYAPIRFGLDFLRVGPDERILGSDPRYWGLTPAQWVCFAALALGLVFLKKIRNKPYKRTAILAEDYDNEERGVEDDDPDDDDWDDDDLDEEPKKKSKKKASKKGSTTSSKKKTGKKKTSRKASGSTAERKKRRAKKVAANKAEHATDDADEDAADGGDAAADGPSDGADESDGSADDSKAGKGDE